MFGNDRNRIRQQFIDARRKQRMGEPLEPLEQVIAELLQEHPEYLPLLDDPEQALGREFSPEDGQSNPFLHLGMHISLREQLATDRPAGIRDLYQRLMRKTGDAHDAEHRLMECLGQVLWEAQRKARPPDEQVYLDCVRGLLR